MHRRSHLMFVAVLLGIQCVYAQISTLNPIQQQHVEVSMRMIGHQVLLSLGDSTSRVLPIEKKEDRYDIKFESEFTFDPDGISAVVDSVIAQTAIASDYVVEVKSCSDSLVVHSYKVGSELNPDIMACRGRECPSGCYVVSITVLHYILPFQSYDMENSELVNETEADAYPSVYQLLSILVLIVIVFGFVVVFIRRRKPVLANDPNLIHIGKYQFNKRNMELWFDEKKIELTSKECDLLQLLCDSTNDTVERETILKMVWGDEGDYVGRTLDVFISKLRKKLEADDNIRIVNIRGIGYKLVLNN